jgi:hypothetical protein
MNTNRKEQMVTRQDSRTANSEQRLMPASWNQNRLTAKLGIEYPIIQGPLGGLSSQRLTAAVSNFGGLGSFGAHSLPPDAIKDVIAEIRSLTFSSKWHFLRYAARYLRRPPIAEDRIISMTVEHVEYWANDLKLKAWVRIKVSIEEFLELLIQHVPDKYDHGIRYFGLASPAGKSLFSSALFVLLREEQKPRPRRLSFEAMSLKYFGSNPLLDSHGQRMRRVGRQAPKSTSVTAA